ncbi:MAG TPA: VOC family protein [Hyphomonadaceae bacterium]|nr:VOC family protein [Hyphomonadaceae bacterium]
MTGRRGMIHHLDLTVSDPASSRPLYELFLGHMGYVAGKQQTNGYVEFDMAPDKAMSVGLVPAKGQNALREVDRYSPGMHHAAWVAPTREDVDALYEKLKAHGANILDAPADYPQYNDGKGYYAVFFSDPDGIKLEYVWTP